jgi:hypothetical protein
MLVFDVYGSGSEDADAWVSLHSGASLSVCATATISAVSSLSSLYLSPCAFCICVAASAFFQTSGQGRIGSQEKNEWPQPRKM